MPFFLFNVLPVFFGVYVAFTRWNIVGSPHWIGTANFTATPSSDKWVCTAFDNTVLYGLIIVPGVTFFGLLFALYVNKRYPLSGLARTLFFAPNVVSATVIGLVWVWMLDTQYGLVNQYLGYLGIPAIPGSRRRAGRCWASPSPRSGGIWAWRSCCSSRRCRTFRPTLYEAAQVDGAGRWSRASLHHLAASAPGASMVVTLQLISTFRIFSQVYVMTNGGPAGSSRPR